MGAGMELPVDNQSRLAVGSIGMGFSVLLCITASVRLSRFCLAYEWRFREIVSDSFGRKRLAIHLVLVAGTWFVIPLYALLLHARPPHPSTLSSLLSSFHFLFSSSLPSSSFPSLSLFEPAPSSSPTFCMGLLALIRFQLLCTLASLGLVLSDWRIDVYEAPLHRARRVWMYELRDAVTAGLLCLA
ncbi:hypothetical protein Naga_101473g2, partial [Nannochloropsis gaditana]